jgi:acid phosphatase
MTGACSTIKQSQSSQSSQNPATTAVRWMKNSVEYKALARQTYQTAGYQLPKMLQDSAETASLEQQGQTYSSLPPAIILDIDETVLNNMAYEYRLIRRHKTYSDESWNHWVRQEKAVALPGAVKFLQKAAREGVTVFYVTNRVDSVKKSTRKNLEKQGLPLKKSINVILTKNKERNWNSTKVNRRKYVAKNYRIIMLFGDNLNDFLPAGKLSHARRKELLQKYHSRFGTRWFILPNPVYGSWQQALDKQ